MNGLLQGAFQVDGPLLDHFSDVLDPVLLVFYTGSLTRRENPSGQRRALSRS